jgi:hypothetical protein
MAIEDLLQPSFPKEACGSLCLRRRLHAVAMSVTGIHTWRVHGGVGRRTNLGPSEQFNGRGCKVRPGHEARAFSDLSWSLLRDHLQRNPYPIP